MSWVMINATLWICFIYQSISLIHAVLYSRWNVQTIWGLIQLLSWCVGPALIFAVKWEDSKVSKKMFFPKRLLLKLKLILIYSSQKSWKEFKVQVASHKSCDLLVKMICQSSSEWKTLSFFFKNEQKLRCLRGPSAPSYSGGRGSGVHAITCYCSRTLVCLWICTMFLH